MENDDFEPNEQSYEQELQQYEDGGENPFGEPNDDNEEQQQIDDDNEDNEQQNNYQRQEHNAENHHYQQQMESPRYQRNEDEEEENQFTPENNNHIHKQSTNSLSPSKKSKSGKKNFVEMNMQVKSKKDLLQESIEKKNQRMSQLTQRKSQMSYMSSRYSLFQDNDADKKHKEWSRTQLMTSKLDKPVSKQNLRNQSNQFITNYESSQSSSANTLGALYSMSKKESAWHRTNQSNINQLKSFKKLDGPEGTESEVIPEVLANVELKQNLSLRSQFDNHNYKKNDPVPEEFSSYQPKEQVIHNKNNQFVQNMRLKAFQSSVI